MSAWLRFSERDAAPNVFYDSAFALAAAPALGVRVEAALLWSRTPPRGRLGFFRDSPQTPLRATPAGGAGLGPCLCAARTPLVDRDLADPVIDAFLTGLTSAHPAAPLCYGLSFLSTARLRPLSIACWPGCPNARLGGQNRTALAPGKERARLRRRLALGCSNCTAV